MTIVVPAPGGAPRVVVAAPASGQGKTTVATGLVAAIRARGFAVSAHKVGPDYIDPGYLGLAAGRPARNLDAWLTSERTIPSLFLHGSANAQVAVIEGVMGLFDGVGGGVEGVDDFASTAHVARLLNAPVLLVVDAASQSRSVAALVHGFASYDPRVRIGGAVPSRHLGLVPVAERSAEAEAAVAAAGDLVARGVDIDAVLALAAGAPRLSARPWDPHLEVGPLPRGHDGMRPRIAVAGGPAFTFSYTEHVELLAAAGAEVVTFDPCRDEALPVRTVGVVIGGGFPEMYANALSDNEKLRKDIADLAASGGVVVGECAGLLYLAASLDGAPMCGVLDVEAEMTGKLTLGYRRAVAVTDSVLCAAGQVLRGHEFHRTRALPTAGMSPAWQLAAPDPDAPGAMPSADEGHVAGNVHASYLHLHWAGRPRIARRIVA